jgi:AcrR family transcriptional regulator
MTQKRDPEATRRLLLQAAFEEIYAHGFQAASLDNILAETGVTKGALYHHFRNKMALGYAVVDEVIRPMIREVWVDSLATSEDPVEALSQTFQRARDERGEQAYTLGCPLNNLAQEMSGLDEGFRQRIQRVLEVWQQGVAQALRRGQACGCVRADLDPEKAATFILAALEGTIGLAKSAQSPQIFEASWYGLERFFESLRPVEQQVA